MRTLMLFGLMLLPVFGAAQVLDTVGVEREVDSLVQVSRALTDQGDFEKALDVSSAAKIIALEKLGHESAAYGSTCFNHGRVTYNKGYFSEAEKWCLESKAIQGKVLGTQHAEYARSLNLLGILYLEMGNFEKAEPLFIEAVAIREKNRSNDPSEYAWSLHNLASSYSFIGNYEKAEQLLLEAKAILENPLGKEDSDYPNCLDNLAFLYEKMGNYEKAEPLFLEAKAIIEKTQGKENFDFANSLHNLAFLNEIMGNYEKAEPLLLESTIIMEKTLGKEHPYYATSLNSLANLYRDIGKFDSAEPIYLEVKEIREKMLGKEHPNYATSLYDMAVMYYRMGNYKKAESFYLEAKAIQEKILGRKHPEYALSLNNLAILYWQMGNSKKAESLFDEIANLNQSRITKAMHHLSERELNNYILSFSRSQAQMLSFNQAPNNDTFHIAQTCFDNILFSKGFLLNAANQIKHLSIFDPVTTEKYNILKSCERSLATEYAKPIAERKGVAELEEKANTLEKELVRTVAGFGEAMQQVTWKEVVTKLKPGEAVVEFVSYQYYDPKPTDSTMYAALLLRPGDVAPAFIPLFEEREIEPLLKGAKGSNLDGINALYLAQEKGKRSLHDLAWQPIEAQLKGVKRIYCSPSGLLYRLNLGAVPTKGNKAFSDEHELVMLGSSRQLVVPNRNTTKGRDAYIAGGIIYEMDRTAIASENEGLTTRGWEESNTLAFHPEDSLRGDTWTYLKGSYSEALGIDSILKSAKMSVQLDMGYFATEEAFRSIGHGKPSPRILHVATHGFFFPDPKSTADDRRRTVDGSEPVFKMSEHPMMRSGLVLAGANEAWATGKAPENREDGILTAYEISQMNLSNTELVVLSACETGLGDIEGDEGVYGLQRAFKVAGAKYLIMSLWKVSDQSTRELMTEFYRQWLDTGMAIPDAFRTAQEKMRTKHPGSPFLWAGFVLVE